MRLFLTKLALEAALREKGLACETIVVYERVLTGW